MAIAAKGQRSAIPKMDDILYMPLSINESKRIIAIRLIQRAAVSAPQRGPLRRLRRRRS